MLRMRLRITSLKHPDRPGPPSLPARQSLGKAGIYTESLVGRECFLANGSSRILPRAFARSRKLPFKHRDAAKLPKYKTCCQNPSNQKRDSGACCAPWNT